jgi:hypothetical protein
MATVKSSNRAPTNLGTHNYLESALHRRPILICTSRGSCLTKRSAIELRPGFRNRADRIRTYNLLRVSNVCKLLPLGADQSMPWSDSHLNSGRGPPLFLVQVI